MVESGIYDIAAKNGWSVSTSVKNEIRSYDFQRKTLSGVAFSFTAEVKDDKVSSLTNEIVSFFCGCNPSRHLCLGVDDKVRGDRFVPVSASCGGYRGHKKQGMFFSLRPV